jgi:succinate dehydrogenase/fumarate reductase cytochrome b subunit
MPQRTTTYYLVKLARITGWLLFLLVLLYIVTGFSLCGEYGVEAWIDSQTALWVHKLFEWPLLAVFGVHSGVTIYFAMRRWGWIAKRRKT